MRSVANSKKGDLARTQYKVINASKNHSLLEIWLLTGKKNQIRVHLSEKGHPIVGDAKYGTDTRGRLALHARSIRFNHPFTNQEMTFETKMPDYFLTFFTNPPQSIDAVVL
jgi:tRNA pseudouridine32 synthase/23S rRNA pseudouridine746 synthase/23S rRNA pseudouridine1911/1915/1917 synthase